MISRPGADIKFVVGQGGAHGLEARATGASGPHAPSPNPLKGVGRGVWGGVGEPPLPQPSPQKIIAAV